jgi:hypothetical protein
MPVTKQPDELLYSKKESFNKITMGKLEGQHWSKKVNLKLNYPDFLTHLPKE